MFKFLVNLLRLDKLFKKKSKLEGITESYIRIRDGVLVHIIPQGDNNLSLSICSSISLEDEECHEIIKEVMERIFNDKL